ncbi:MAG TPA: hypothetical protein VFE37_14725 [Chloroflexota bacterium]|nr:hypothetical protein [Chloroflexota bacterium]
MVSQTLLALRATLAAAPLDQLAPALAVRLGAMLGAALARWADGPSAVYGDADSSVVFTIREELERQDILLRQSHY